MTTRRAVVAYYRLERPDARPALAESQRRVATWLRTRRRILLEPFVEGSGRGAQRPELARALARCESARATLLVPRLVEVGADLPFLESLLASRVPLAAADTPGLRRNALVLLREVARHRSRAAGERVRRGLDGARRRGTRLGSPRPAIGARRAAASLRRRADARAEQLAPWIAEIQLGNPDCSLRELARVLEALRLPTPRGGRWGPSAVRNALRRLRADPTAGAQT